MMYLGVNCGLGNTDVSVHAGWLGYPRAQDGVSRRAALWREKVKALRASLKQRNKSLSRADDALAFINRHGRRWVREQDPGARSQGKRPATVIDAIAVE